MELWSIPAAIAAGACFASAGILQQRVARTRSKSESMSPRLLLDLLHQRLWLAGIGLAVLSYAFQALALAVGPLSLVQPLIVTELIFALPLSARLHHLGLHAREWLGVAAVAGGLAIAILAAAPSQGDPRATTAGWLVVLAIVGGTAGLALLIGHFVSGTSRASLFALAGGLIMGTQSALFSVTINHLREGFVPLFTAWQTYLLIVASVGGLLLIQSAYQAGPLAASLPVLDGIEPVVAITIGIALFGETLAGGALRHAGAIVAMLIVLVGIVVLDTSPVIKRLHEQEDKEAGADGQQDRSDGQFEHEPG